MMEQQELITYWTEGSDRDFTTMEHLIEKGDYHWALFIGHLVLEKLLKGYYVKQLAQHAPPIHNLLSLAERAGLPLTEEQKDVLDTVSTFNIRARYDNEKAEFYHLCDKTFTDQWAKEIREFRIWIKEQLSKT